jgi:hypothetical protein
MKKTWFIFIFILLLTACCTTAPVVPTEPEIIYVTKPLKDPLPHPVMPILEIPEGDITVEMAMEHVILLNGAILKLQLLVEIYEREDRKLPEGFGNKKFEGMTLEELRVEYLKLLGITPTGLLEGGIE